MLCVCLATHADLQVALHGSPNDPTKWQEISKKLPVMKGTLSQVIEGLTAYVSDAGAKLPTPPSSAVP